MRLVYLYVYENEFFDEMRFNFTNDYAISFADNNRTEIVIEKKEGTIIKGKEMYSDYISSLSVLVGTNGIGKTTLLNFMGMQDVETWKYYDNISYFMLYEAEGAWYIETKENEENIKFLLDVDRGDVQRHWRKVRYDKDKRKLINSCDASVDYLFPDIREEHEKVLFFYYKDQSTNQLEWTKAYGTELDEVEESLRPSSTIERINIKNTVYDIYYFMNHKREMIQEIFKKDIDTAGNLILNTDSKDRIIWKKYEDADLGKTFIIQMLFNLYVRDYRSTRSKKTIEIRKSLADAVKTERSELPDISDYEWYKEKLIKEYTVRDIRLEKLLRKLVSLLELVDTEYFIWLDGIYVREGTCMSAEKIEFHIADEYDSVLYDLLKCMSEFNEELINYRMFTYQYDSMSAGEAKCIDIFSGIYQSIIKAGGNIREKDVVLLLDEPDKGMHPEMARKFISIINDFSEELGKQNGCMFQYIISTHSPLLLLDVPGDWVFKLTRTEGKTVLGKGCAGVMFNVADLMKDAFFLESPFGVLAERYFKDVQGKILDLSEDGLDDEIDIIKKQIDVIYEPALKKYLYEKLEEKIEEICPKNKLICYYEKKIKELRGND